MLSNTITHLVSDCDGVLIDSEAIALEVLLSELQPRVPTNHQLASLIRPLLGLELGSLLSELSRAMDIMPFDPAETSAIREAVESECDRRLTLVPGVAQALAEIDLPKAVASNSSSKRVHDALRRTGLSPFFGARIYTADTVGCPKPHPAVYLAAAAGFGVAPGACLALEDSVTGVIAAATAGMHVLGFVGGGHVNPEQAMQLQAAGAHSTFDNMAQLPALIHALRHRD